MAMAIEYLNKSDLSLSQKLWRLNWLFVLVLLATASVGFAMLYSAANGSLEPWAGRQIIRFSIGIGLMLLVAMTNIRIWLKYSYVLYLVALVLQIGRASCRERV